MSLELSDDDRSALAAEVARELDTGRYGERFVLSRRQLLSIAGGAGGVAALTALGVDPAAAQSAAGQVGTQSSPADVFAFDLDVQGALQRDLDAGGQAIENVGSVSTDDVSLEPTDSFANAIAANGTVDVSLTGYSNSDNILVTTLPRDTEDGCGFVLDSIKYDNGSDELIALVTETEGVSGVAITRVFDLS